MTKRVSAPLFTGAALFIVYWLTLAPGVTLWDSGEFLAAIRTLGIPHPAGTPLYILVAKCWSFLFAPVFGFARAINLLSAAATAAGCAIVGSLFARWMENAAAGICAALVSGAMSTIWLNATETEVYALAFLFGCVLLWVADRAGRSGESRWAMLAVYLCGLGWSLHLSALVVVPAAVLLMVSGRDGYLAIPSGTRRADGRQPTGRRGTIRRSIRVIHRRGEHSSTSSIAVNTANDRCGRVRRLCICRSGISSNTPIGSSRSACTVSLAPPSYAPR